VTGAFLGQAAALVVLFLVLLIPLLPTLRTPATGLVGRATRLRDLFGRAWVPILGFTLIAALQNIDIVWVKREIGGDEAGSYAAASVAAKAVIWIAIGLGLYLLPEAVKRTRTGGDARPVLGKSLGLIALVAVPMIVLYAFFGKQVMAAVFGDDLTAASSVLPFLALAMALLACAYLAVQYLIALERANFLPVLGLAAAAELILLPVVGAVATNVALVVVALQLAMLPAFFALVTRSVLRRPSAAPA
jgi:O-antigen/teichoic acid export membrane protein